MKKSIVIGSTVLLALALVIPAFATVKVDAARLIPVLDGGRVKPLDTYAREQVHNITGKSSLGGQAPLSIFFQWMVIPDEAAKAEVILNDYLPLREQLGFDHAKKRYSLNSIRDNAKFNAFIDQLRQKQGDAQSKLDKEAGALYHRAMLLNSVLNQDLPIIPSGKNGDQWVSPHALLNTLDQNGQQLFGAWTRMSAAFYDGNQAVFDEATNEFIKLSKSMSAPNLVSESHLKVEEFYSVSHPARLAWLLYLVTFLLFLSFSIANKPNLRWIAVVMWIAGFAAHTLALGLRWYIAGRAPWSNMYESMQMLSWGIMFFALMFDILTKVRIFLPASAVLGVIALVINDQSPFDPFVTPLAPVLKSYWLTIHVMVMMLGYSACALAMGIGHFVLGYEVWGKNKEAELVQLDKSLYRVVQVAMLFLIAGIILGAMWANESWGRYWGWDPKETWALITWFYYLAVAHGRFSHWWKRTGTAVLSIVGFPIVLMTYYGVNFFLVGLHSYAGGGSPDPMPPVAWAYLLAELVFLVIYWQARKKKLSTSPSEVS